jgi:hypothetical protein
MSSRPIAYTSWCHQSSPRSLRKELRKGLGKKIFKKTRQLALNRSHKPAA